ncbi:FecR family protein [Gaoshiqia sp. Z1-71]|uniref:FecR family protein n=1 Tax=Gaoshiqia hydrogeniformans TaxID=3290090 RepID=UPI003BF8646F
MKFDSTILKKYLSGKFSLNDKAIVDEYFADDQYTSLLDAGLNEYWNSCSGKTPAKDLNPLLQKINHRILLQSAPKTSKLSLLWQFYSRVAAILLLPVLILSVYLMLQNEDVVSDAASFIEVHSPYGSRTKFSLPDGSTGWLNGGSLIRYPVQFGAERKVVLDGEAFFEVVKNPQSPFIVDATSLQIKVLGTSFNVVAYEVDSISEVVVASGKVEVTGEGQRFKQVLLPSERLICNRVNHQLSKSNVYIENYTSWKSGQLMFLNDKLDEVVRKLSRYYHVDIEVQADVRRTQQFRAIMQHESIDEVLRYMKLTMDIDYIISERTAGEDDLLSKRKIVITKKS